MKKQRTKNIVSYSYDNLPVDTKTDWKRVDAMSDKELTENAASDKDNFIADDNFWRDAYFAVPLSIGKERITIRLDKDVLQWLKNQGRGYQSRINSILRTIMTTANSSRYRKAR